MNKLTSFTLGAILLTSAPVFAQQSSVVEQSSLQPVEIGNKHCPVSGRQIGLMGPGIKVEYNGKLYTLCCPGCRSTFYSDPEKYSKIAQADAS